MGVFQSNILQNKIKKFGGIEKILHKETRKAHSFRRGMNSVNF